MSSITPNSSTPPTPPSIPFKVASAYGVKPINVRPIANPMTQAASGQTGKTGGIMRGADQLLAGSVGTPVDFMGDAPAKANPGGSPLAFYRHPADTNAVATSIDLGRSLDVEG